MIIECSYCEAKVDAKVLAQHKEADSENGFEYMISFAECPVCKNTLVGCQELIQISAEDWKWDDATRVWPSPKEYLDWNIPDIVR